MRILYLLVLMAACTISKKSPTSDSLFFVDGKRCSQLQALATPSNTIFQIEVLTDSVAKAKYGKRGEHGAVLITTKHKP